jgi:hypothetical protein
MSQAAKTGESVAKLIPAVNEKNTRLAQEKSYTGPLRSCLTGRYSKTPCVLFPANPSRERVQFHGNTMGKELPILPAVAQPAAAEQTEIFVYSRVFCQKENSPPLRLLIDFLKARGQTPIVPSNVDEAALDEWAWVQIALGYHRDKKPIHIFCVRDRGSYKDVFDQEQGQFLELLNAYEDIEAGLVREYVTRSRFILTTRFAEKDVTDEGYDFNGWILEFYQEHCNGIVQIDNQGFYSPKGELIVDLSAPVED